MYERPALASKGSGVEATEVAAARVRGRVEDAGDLLEVQIEGGSASVLLPFTRAAVPTVDLDSSRLIVDPPDGLF